MKLLALLLALCAIEAALPSPSRAADPRDPDWPCVQPKVPQMSVAAMWDGPSIADVGDSWKDDPQIQNLVARLAARRTPLDVAEKAITDFITGSAAEKQDKAKKLFAGVFDTLSQQRSEVMSGIGRVARNEKELADRIGRTWPHCASCRTSRKRTNPRSARSLLKSNGARAFSTIGANRSVTSAKCRPPSNNACSRSGMRFGKRWIEGTRPIRRRLGRVWLLAAGARRLPSHRCLADTTRRFDSPSSAPAWRHSMTSNSPDGSR